MRRLTQAIAYINSEASDWNVAPTKYLYDQFTHLDTSNEETKKFRRFNMYGKVGETFEEYKERLKVKKK